MTQSYATRSGVLSTSTRDQKIKYERLEDRLARDKHAKAPVYLLFLLKKSIKKNYIIPEVLKAPDAPFFTIFRKYNEVEYMMNIQEVEYMMLFNNEI